MEKPAPEIPVPGGALRGETTAPFYDQQVMKTGTILGYVTACDPEKERAGTMA